MTPQQFIAKWGAPGGVAGPAYALNEEQGAQSHFLDLCELLGVPKPGSADGYRFEEKSTVIGGKAGYADVFMRGVFAWENKAPGKNLDAALKQLLTYSLALASPPILVVSDRLLIRIHTQFTGHPSQTHTVLLDELDQPDKLALLRRIWTAPESFKPRLTNRDITEQAAKSFANLADGLRRRGQDPDRVAHFLTQCLFCFFAEDVGLLPRRMFEGLVNNKNLTADKLTRGLVNLLTVMRDGGLYGNDDIPWFNGGLFQSVHVPELSILEVSELRNAAALNWSAIDVSIFGTLFERGLDPSKRSQLGAHYTDTATIARIVEPLLTRPLMQKWAVMASEIQALMAKSKRRGDKNHRAAQDKFVLWLESLKAYRVLDPACGSGNFLYLALKALKDIEHQSHLDAAALGLDRQADLVTGPHNVLGIELNGYAAELARVTVWIGELQWRIDHGYDFKINPVLDPLDHIECRDALLCFEGGEVGSDVDARSGQVYGPFADRANSAPSAGEQSNAPSAGKESTAPSVGDESSAPSRGDESTAPSAGEQSKAASAGKESGVGSEFRTKPSTATSNVERNSALTPVSVAAGEKAPTSINRPSCPISVSSEGKRISEATWPKADIVIGNPPFLGGSKKRGELGGDYFEALESVFAGRVPAGADLVCYWFDKARLAIEGSHLNAAGLVSTNSLRGGANRKVLDAICERSRIFDAWSDEAWVNDGAAVRVSLVCFGHGTGAKLDGVQVEAIHSDLTPAHADGSGADLTAAAQLPETADTCFMGASKKAPFDIAGEQARQWLQQPNPNGQSNARVLRPLCNGIDLTRRWGDRWIVDFGTHMPEADAMLFEAPFAYVAKVVRPIAVKNSDKQVARNWWRHARPRVDMRAALAPLARYIITAAVSKHRCFIWMHAAVLPDQATLAIARSDDTTFGILHSRFHELWSLRLGTSLEDRPRYTPTTCFETFPFPDGLTPADTAYQRTETLENGAVIPVFAGQSQGAISPTGAETGVRAEFRSTLQPAGEVAAPNSDPT
ncbi:MAG: hypothetical protein K9K38_16305, partial [Rhodoferax sp.]|nr:hypothetical protein [Rhodoferax sp.]